MAQRVVNRWLPVVVWITVIYTTIPVVRRLREAFVARWPAELIGYGVMAVVVAVTAAGILLLRRRRRRIELADALWLLGVSTILLLWTRRLMGSPEEAVHFLEYGVLGVLLYRALRTRIPDDTVFFAAALIGLLVGTVDEIIQWVVPGRYWDYRDIVLNGGASVLIQIAIWRLAPRPSMPIRPSSLRLICRLAAAETLLLTICVVSTPQRLAHAPQFFHQVVIPKVGNDVISEYGHLHRLDDRTLFRSRLTLDALAREDAARASEVAAILDASRRHYGRWIHTYPVVDDPFTYEARVHLFARDRHLARARKLTPKSPDYRDAMTTAVRENLILERFFGATLKHSSYVWPPRKRLAFEAAHDAEAEFVSAVAAHLITWVGEKTLRALCLGALVALLICDVLLGRRAATRSPPGSQTEQRGRNPGRTEPETRD
jgi:hypothetical protein